MATLAGRFWRSRAAFAALAAHAAALDLGVVHVVADDLERLDAAVARRRRARDLKRSNL